MNFYRVPGTIGVRRGDEAAGGQRRKGREWNPCESGVVRMKCARFVQGLVLMLVVTLGGCRSEVPREELGELYDKLPVVAGTEDDYPLPELDGVSPPAAATPEEGK